MGDNEKPPDLQIAYAALCDGLTSARASLAIVGRWWWNVQMQFLVNTGTMRPFRAYPWLFVAAGFLLLAFIPPLGIAFAVSAFSAAEMDPKAKYDYIVPLKRENADTIGKYERPPDD